MKSICGIDCDPYYMKYPTRLFQNFITAYLKLHCVASNIKKTLIRKTYLSLLVFFSVVVISKQFFTCTFNAKYVTEEQKSCDVIISLTKKLIYS